MKKTILSGAVALAGLCATSAFAQFNYHNGDLIAAFGNNGAFDVVVNLGNISNFQLMNGGTTTFDLSSVLNSTFGGVGSGLYWSVFGVNDTSTGGSSLTGQTDPNSIWATLARANPANQTHAPQLYSGNSLSYQLPLIFIQSLGNNTSPNMAGPGQIQDYSLGVELVTNSPAVGGFSQMMNSPYSGDFQGTWYYNTLNNNAGVSDLYLNNPGVTPSTYLGNFSLNNSGTLTYSSVPEPSTCALLGGSICALAGLRRRACQQPTENKPNATQSN